MSIKNVKIDLNAGVSSGVIDWVKENYPNNAEFENVTLGNFATIVLTGLNHDEVQTFLNKFKLIYPFKVTTILND